MATPETTRPATPGRSTMRLLGILGVVGAFALACSGSDTGNGSAGDNPAADGAPTIVVTTDILGDVVSNMVGDQANVEVIMPSGASPHEFAPSAAQAQAMRSADVLVANGAGFEAGLATSIESARSDGAIVCTAVDGVDTLTIDGEMAAGQQETHGDEHTDADSHTTEADAVDPHFFTDPVRMAQAVDYLAGCISDAVPALDTPAFASSAADYHDELTALDDETGKVLEVVPEARRKLVTNHEVFQYFADRYDFEVVGAIIPSTSTQSEADAANLKALADLIRAESIPAVFADTSSPRRLADALADEAGDVEVVTLFSETLGPDGGQTYVDMVRTNAKRISDALE